MNVRLTLYSLFLSLLLSFPVATKAAILLSEIQVGGDKATDEFVELYNTSDTSVNLKDYSLRRKSQGDTSPKGNSLKTFNVHDAIPAHGYFLWASSAGIFKDHADTTTGGGLSDNNSLGLFDKDGGLIESLTWGTGHALPFAPTSFENPDKKESLTRDLDDLSWSKTKKISPTNSKGEIWKEEIPPPGDPKPFKSIVINEVFPNPKEKGDLGEFIELYNPLSEAVGISGWEIRDATASGKYVFPDGAKIESLGYLVITDKDFTLSLNNGKETLSLSDSEKRLVHTVSYEKTKEDVTLNLVGDKLRGGKTPTPGKENILNTDPVTKEKVPKKGHRDIAVTFSTKGKDSDGDKLKYTWDFGDGHKSYKANTAHKYKKSGKYTVTLTTDDGVDTTTETFEIKIEKYEAPKLRIVALMPNPKGKDSDLEWIEIENREKKTVDLQGFSIATGAKKKSLVNHPVRESVTLKGKSVQRLTRQDALFTFNNKRGVVELRSPDGEAIASIKYNFEKALPDDVILEKVKGKPLRLKTMNNNKENPSATATTIEKTRVPESVPQETLPIESVTTPETSATNAETKDSSFGPQPLETVPKNHFFDSVGGFLRSIFY